MSKRFYIEEYFKRWHRDVARTKELIDGKRHYLEGVLALSCYLGALGAMRYPTLRDGEAYVKVVLEYSGKRDFYEQVDLLFFLQWPKSKLNDHGSYKELKNHAEIATALTKVYGSADDVKANTRYASKADVIRHASEAKIAGFDEQNLRDKLPLFSLHELLYRYLRCDAVHNVDFPFVNECTDVDGNVEYEENHAITANVLLETVDGIITNLRIECTKACKWPYQL